MIHKRWSVLLGISLAYASDSVYEGLGIGPDQQPIFSPDIKEKASSNKVAPFFSR